MTLQHFKKIKKTFFKMEHLLGKIQWSTWWQRGRYKSQN
jgi:hypothetical protein